ncbi:DUF6892 domain-containing protein [Chryseolinea lacunae]|uniref:EF-hand domain-containing protein n=1 Tax=Chryseolinea lacunae TaxID=2801331 RepID=A0ABS1KNV4_9BACT|nr:hypothetical protein [Chryseolinea lacunae]MBL0740908.1 hypothetical protein [Chryseolinea lacunae]
MRISLDASGLFLNEHHVQFPVTKETFAEWIGPPDRTVTLKYNTLLTWDALGIYAFSKDQKNIDALAVLLSSPPRYKYQPEHTFQGDITLNGKNFQAQDFVDNKMTLGGVLAYHDLDDDEKTSVSLAFSVPEPEPPKDHSKYVLTPRQGDFIVFKDFNFKLAVVNILMYEKKLITPAFDLYEFADLHRDRKIDIEKEGYAFIAEVTRYFTDLQIDRKFASKITKIVQDGGDEIYGQLLRFWDGEDNTFNIGSADDFDQFPNLKRVSLFGDTSSSVLDALRARGIKVTDS